MALSVNATNNNIFKPQMVNLAPQQTTNAQTAKNAQVQNSQSIATLNAQKDSKLLSAIKKHENSETYKEVRDIGESALTGFVTGGPVGAAVATAKRLAGIKKFDEIGKDMVEEANSKETKAIWSDFRDAGKGFGNDLRNSGKMTLDQAIATGIKTPARFGNAACKTVARTTTAITKNVIGEKTAKLGATAFEFGGTLYESSKTVVKQAIHSGIDAGKGAKKAVVGIFTGDKKAVKEGLNQMKNSAKELAKECKNFAVNTYNKGKKVVNAACDWGKKVGKGAAREAKEFVKNPVKTVKKWGGKLKNKGKKVLKGFRKMFTGK